MQYTTPLRTLTIVKYPDPLLKKKSQPVEKPGPALHALIRHMTSTMDANDGVGLAAPQIGLSQCIIVVKDVDKNHGFFNPQILKESRDTNIDEEGCLSLPGIFLKIKRASEVMLVAQTPNGKTMKIVAKGLGARIFQHEIDHLRGKLIIDRVSPWKRLKLRKKLKELNP